MIAGLRAWRALTLANLRMYVRNPVATFSLAAVLLALLVAVKVLLGGQGAHTRVVLVDASSTRAAATMEAEVRSVPTFDVTTASPQAAARMLAQGQADMEIAIPPDFVARDAEGRPLPARLSVTYRVGTAGEASVPIVEGLAARFDQTVLGEVPTVAVTASALHTRVTGAIDVLLPGIVAFNVIGSALMLPAGIFAGYRSSGVLRRVQATGVAPAAFVLAHATASFLLGTVQTAAILAAAALLFSVHLDVPSLFALVVAGYLVFLAAGLAVAGWVRDPQRVTAVAQGVAFPMIFIGLLAASIPAGVATVTRYLPVSYLTDGLQRLGDGGALPAVAPDLAWLLGWAAVLLVAAGRVFRWG